MIIDYLSIGKENAKTGKDLARALHCDVRDISAGVETERRKGLPIIASCDANSPGYYIAESAEELNRYCDSLGRRANEIRRTRAALLEAAREMQRQEG